MPVTGRLPLAAAAAAAVVAAAEVESCGAVFEGFAAARAMPFAGRSVQADRKESWAFELVQAGHFAKADFFPVFPNFEAENKI